MMAWLGERWTEARAYGYRVHGVDRDDASVVRLD